ncbi:MAG: hypothetical protein AMK71_11585, partial [Nitrospira bacterium SG8_35_4]
MINFQNNYRLAIMASVMLLSMAVSVNVAASIEMVHSYKLANFNGYLLTQWGKVYVDRERGETYVIDRVAREIKIYNNNGMEVYV